MKITTDARRAAGAADRPIRDATCWHCGQPFETRDPRQGLCPGCERLADEDTRVTRIEGLAGADMADEVVIGPE
jgi:Zn finger protein HypA/HybF involved in hydrogenase expression